MIDFHSHVLHSIDDGSHNVEESITMLKMSYRQGIRTMVFTPHFRLGEHNIKSFLKERQDRLDEIREALTEEDRKEIPKVVLGAEIEYKPGMNKWDYLPELCIRGTKYLMTEMPFIPWSKAVLNTIDDIALNSGFTPILPHIDRYINTFTREDYIEHYYNMPVKIQMNAIFLNDRKNVPYYASLFAEKKIHLLGSDCHSCEWRSPDLGPAVKALGEVCGQEAVDFVKRNAEEMLKGAIYEEM